MKKIARQALMMGLLGAWMLIAVGSGQQHSHKCNAEWKVTFNDDEKSAFPEEMKSIYQQADGETNVDLHHPGFMNLIFQ